MRETERSLFPWAKEVDISMELYREYTFISDAGVKAKIRIDNPIFIVVGDNGHRVSAPDGSHYIPYGWIHLMWVNEDQENQQFHYQCVEGVRKEEQ